MIIRYATVISVTPLKIRFIGEDEESETTYTKLKSYTPTQWDKVAVIKDDKEKYLIIGGVN